MAIRTREIIQTDFLAYMVSMNVSCSGHESVYFNRIIAMLIDSFVEIIRFFTTLILNADESNAL